MMSDVLHQFIPHPEPDGPDAFLESLPDSCAQELPPSFSEALYLATLATTNLYIALGELTLPLNLESADWTSARRVVGRMGHIRGRLYSVEQALLRIGAGDDAGAKALLVDLWGPKQLRKFEGREEDAGWTNPASLPIAGLSEDDDTRISLANTENGPSENGFTENGHGEG